LICLIEILARSGRSEAIFTPNYAPAVGTRVALERRVRTANPTHIGFIPDGNRRWAEAKGLPKEDGYSHGIAPGLQLFELCKSTSIEEVSVYCFTQDNTRRPSAQTARYRSAVVEFALEIHKRGAALLVLGDERSALFPDELKPFRKRTGTGIKVNLL
jgi:undecaprenyl diphosphate synthase